VAKSVLQSAGVTCISTAHIHSRFSLLFIHLHYTLYNRLGQQLQSPHQCPNKSQEGAPGLNGIYLKFNRTEQPQRPFQTPFLHTRRTSTFSLYSLQNIKMADNGEQSPQVPQDPPVSEHLNIKVTDNNNEVFFKIKRSTQLKKLMDAFCDRQGKMPNTVRFLFDGQRVQPNDSPDSVSGHVLLDSLKLITTKLEMADGDTLEVHQEQIGGC